MHYLMITFTINLIDIILGKNRFGLRIKRSVADVEVDAALS